jgi:uroporphyrinogen-III decarboxylase
MLEMTSKERMIAAMLRQDVDRVPVPQPFWIHYPKAEAFSWGSLDEEIAWKKSYGFDPYISFPGPMSENSYIKQRNWIEDNQNEEYPMLCSEWTSSDGILTAKLRLTDDYPYEKIHFFSDYNTSRFIKPLLTTGEDMLTFVKMDPLKLKNREDLSEWRERCKYLKSVSDKEGIAVSCYGGATMDYLIWGSTADQAIMLALDYPEETMEFLKYVNKYDEEMMSLCFEMGADFSLRRGWYDSADFWGPKQFKQFVSPFIQNAVILSHQAGIPCCYLMCTGIIPMLKELSKLDFDCLLGIEPVCTGQDIKKIVEVLGKHKSFRTGLSAPIHIGRSSKKEVRQAVRNAFEIFGTKGFLLSAEPSIRRHWPWENVEAMMDEYKKIVGS